MESIGLLNGAHKNIMGIETTINFKIIDLV
jgi:hypothetical protein